VRDFRILQAVGIVASVLFTVDTARSLELGRTSVQATVIASCIASAAPVDSKPSRVGWDAGRQNGVGSIFITCKRGVPYHVHASLWGSMRGGISLVARGTSTAQQIPIFAEVLPRRVASSGVVSDVSRPRDGIRDENVVVSVTF